MKLIITLTCPRIKYKYLRRASGLMFYPTDHDNLILKMFPKLSKVELVINSPHPLDAGGEWWDNVHDAVIRDKLHSFIHVMNTWGVTENSYTFTIGE